MWSGQRDSNSPFQRGRLTCWPLTPCPHDWSIGAPTWFRPRDLPCFRRALCQLSYGSVLRATRCGAWSGRRGSNPRPSPWQGDALPAELLPQGRHRRRACPVPMPDPDRCGVRGSAGGESRTPMTSRPAEFESAASAVPPHPRGCIDGAGGRTRTDALPLTRRLLSPLSYTGGCSRLVGQRGGEVRWSRRTGSNRRLAAYEAAALPAELLRHGAVLVLVQGGGVVLAAGVEPAVSHARRLYRPLFHRGTSPAWCAREESNLRLAD